MMVAIRKIPLLLGCVFLIGLAGLRAEAAPGVAAARSFQFQYRVTIPALASGHGLNVWLPLPLEDAFQHISDLRVWGPTHVHLGRESAYGNRYVLVRYSGDELRHPHTIVVIFHVVRKKAAGLTPAQPLALGNAPQHCLQSERMVPVHYFDSLTRRVTRGASGDWMKAQRIYHYVLAHMRYDKSGSGWGRGDAVFACTEGRGNCTDFHSLLIGMSRSAGIPALFEIGFLLPERSHAGQIPGYHCWVLMNLPQSTSQSALPRAWMPIDASEAWLNPSRRDFYFGSLDPDRVLFTRGRDLRLGPEQQGPPLNYFIDPYAELDGKPWQGMGKQFRFQDDAGPGGR